LEMACAGDGKKSLKKESRAKRRRRKPLPGKGRKKGIPETKSTRVSTWTKPKADEFRQRTASEMVQKQRTLNVVIWNGIV